MWRNGDRPEDIEAMEDDDIVFECNVIGRPKPTVSLTFNAQPLHQGLNDSEIYSQRLFSNFPLYRALAAVLLAGESSRDMLASARDSYYLYVV